MTDDREHPIAASFIATARELDAEVVEVGGIPDHVHVLARIPATLAVADLVKRLKGASSHLITREHGGEGFFKWQKGYGAFTVSRWDLARVREYIRRQKEHHGAGTLRRQLESISEE